MKTGYLGIDAGTQGLAVLLTDQDMKVVASGDGHYDMLPGLAEGCYEQNPQHWWNALKEAVDDLRNKFPAFSEYEVKCIGISGQMHGEVLSDEHGKVLGPARLWCDSRNATEEAELTELLQVKMPKRITAARWLWTVRNRTEVAEKTRHLTTPSGWLAFQLTGEWKLGIGDAAGMFPIDQATKDFNQKMLKLYSSLVGSDFPELGSLLPQVCLAGQDGGTLTDAAAAWLGLSTGIPVAAAEGDQPAAMAGSLIGKSGMVSVSFGTSVCANSVGDRPFQGVSSAVDHFCAVDGKPINMVWLRNGTTFMNTVVEMFAMAADRDRDGGFETLIPQVLAAPADCEGLLALPFMDDEPGLQIAKGGSAMLYGLNAENAKPGNAIKAALLAIMFNLRLGSELLDQQGFPRSEMVLTGGLTKTPQLAQILADVFATPVTVLESADEGTAWGAALLAKFRHSKMEGTEISWTEFLSEQDSGSRKKLTPNESDKKLYDEVYRRYRDLVNNNR